MAIRIEANEALKTIKNYAGHITEYSKETLVLILPTLAENAVQFSWISPTNNRFSERVMNRAPELDVREKVWVEATELDWENSPNNRQSHFPDEGSKPYARNLPVGRVLRIGYPPNFTYEKIKTETVGFAYEATIWPVMTAGVNGTQDVGQSMFSFRSGVKFSPIIKIAVDRSIYPEQSDVLPTIAEGLQEQINLLTNKLSNFYTRAEIDALLGE